ncbi:hypothetical protein EV702DRAFT_234318 [Suillus placidus]|uniref:C2H2-type domain-containing protein n=1 Tax=Suillus placidus TaxID=48579 RepID=A0A9P7A5X0_9AGAM|nr:hypothetical protein EV702DRAFT_234318 [Suillus placidus]
MPRHVLLPSIRDIFPEISIYTQALSQSTDLSPFSDHIHGSSGIARRISYRTPRGADDLQSPTAYSFNDVLRADLVTSSLEHVASTTTLRSLGTASSQGNPRAGIADRSAPTFRVSKASFVPPPQSQQRHRHMSPGLVYSSSQSPGDDGFTVASPTPHVQDTRPHPSSSVLSFAVSDPPSYASTITINDGRRPYLKSSRKHQCPHCDKRFNRPSSMQIHVNMHTGAKRTSDSAISSSSTMETFPYN